MTFLDKIAWVICATILAALMTVWETLDAWPSESVTGDDK